MVYWGEEKHIMTTVEVTSIGSSSAIVLPSEVVARLRVREGDKLQLVETPNGIELTPYDPELAEQLEVAEQVMQSDATVLKKLAE